MREGPEKSNITAISGDVHSPRRAGVAPFAGHGCLQVQSSPRKQESTPQAIGNAPLTGGIPAFATMTSVLKGITSQMTSSPGGSRD